MEMQEQLDARFWDGKKGGYYFSPGDGEQVIARQKESYDGAVPSGNAVAMMNLIRLSRMTGIQRWEDRAKRIGAAFADTLAYMPSAHTMFMAAINWMQENSLEIVIVGDPGDDDMQQMLRIVRQAYLPNKVLLLKNTGAATSPDISELAPYTKEMMTVGGRATAYLCSNRTCQPPVTELSVLENMVGGYRRRIRES